MTKCDYDGIKRGSVYCRQPAKWRVTFAEMRGPLKWNLRWRYVRVNYCVTHECATRDSIKVPRGPQSVVVFKRVGRARLKTSAEVR